MKKTMFVLMLLMFSLACTGMFVSAATETALYTCDYDDLTDVIPDGETYYKYTNSGTSSWHLNNAGSYGKVFLVNDSLSLDGNYMVSAAYGNNYAQWTYLSNPGTVLTSDFSISFSFMNTCIPGDQANWTPFDLCIYPAKTFANDTLPGNADYSVFSYYYDSGTMYMKGLDGKISEFATAKSVWYDVKATFGRVASGNPVYTIQVKKSDSDTWSTVISDYPLPSTWDCSVGLKSGKTIYHGGYSAIGFDHLKLASVSSYDITVQQAEGGTVSVADGMTSAAPGTTVTVSAVPNDGYKLSKITVNGAEQKVSEGKTEFVIASDSVVTAVFADKNDKKQMYYKQTYTSSYDFSSEDAKNTGYERLKDGSGSSWALNFAGSYGKVYLAADSYAKNGKYALIGPSVSSPDSGAAMIFLTSGNELKDGENSKFTMTDDYTFDFSFNSLSVLPDGASCGNAKLDLYMYPDADYSSNGRSQEGHLLSYTVGEGGFVVNDTEEQAMNEFSSVKDVWYDMRVKVNFKSTVPVYSVYMKASSDSDYTLLAQNVSFPKSGNYSKGISMFGVLAIDNRKNYGRAVGIDDVYLYKTEEYEVNLLHGTGGNIAFSDSDLEGLHESVAPGTKVTVTLSPDFGYETESIQVNGVAQPVTESFLLTVNEDTVVQATFREIPKVAPAISKTAVVQGTTYDGKPAVVAYSQLNQFTTASNVRYGMYFWRGNAEDKETANVLPLYVCDSQTSEPAAAGVGQAFGIRCFGTAITSGNTYSFQPFVGDTVGEAVEYTLADETAD